MMPVELVAVGCGGWFLGLATGLYWHRLRSWRNWTSTHERRHITCVLVDGLREVSRKQLQGTDAPDVIRQPHGRGPVHVFTRTTQSDPDVWTYQRVT